MSIKGNLQSSLGNQKSRVFLFLMLIIIIIVALVAYTSRDRSVSQQRSDAGVSANTNVVNPGEGLAPIPGTNDTSSEYEALQRKNYKELVQKAIDEKGQPVAALPSLATGENLSAIPGFNDPKPNYTDKLTQQLNDQQKAQQALLTKQQDAVAKQQIDAANKASQELMSRQINLLARNWQVVPQQFVAGNPIVYAVANNRTLNSKLNADGTAAVDNKPKIYYKAGDILFGIVMTSVNSDQPGPVLARIVSGPLNGSKLIGVINAATIPQTALAPKVSRSLILEFNLLNIPGKRLSVPITAVAIDPATANTGLATSVNNHYLLRYGTFFASNFLSGIGQAIQSPGQVKVVTGNGVADVGSSSKFSPAEQSKIAIGRTAEAFTKTLNYLDTPPTIKISSGTAIGILLQNDLVIEGDNTQQLVNQANANNALLGQRPLIPSGAQHYGALCYF
jgi:intracellular multiplication protein IcmE